MLTRGTPKRSADDIAGTVESWAGSLDGFSGRNSLGISGKFLSKDLYAGLELFSDLILNADFPDHEIEKVREDILAAIRAKKDRPTAQLFELFYKTLYPHYPYGHPATGDCGNHYPYHAKGSRRPGTDPSGSLPILCWP